MFPSYANLARSTIAKQGDRVLAEFPVVLAGFNNPLISTGGLGTVMRATADLFGDLTVVCNDTVLDGAVIDKSIRHKIVPVSTPTSTVELYQRQFCKSYLWPALHEDMSIGTNQLLDGPHGLRILRAVSEFSESFAQVVLQVAEEAATTPLIWFSDYSMIPVAGHFGRLTNNRYPVGISIRSSVGRTDVPQMTEQATRILADGILAADFVSVHRRRDVYHLLELVGRSVGHDAICWEECTVASKRGSTVISDIPMGNCPDHWHTVGRSKIAIDTCQSVLDQCPSMQVVLSVSRLEHHKGIETELDVIDRLLRYFPDLLRTFVFYRIMPMFPEYNALSSYRQLNERIVDRIEIINSKYGDPKWKPISLLSGPSLIHEELAGYYRAADVLMVLSHADGFNHVSLEAILAKQPSDRPLGLLLSDTGSADCLGESFMPAVKGSLTEMALQLSKILRRDQQSRTLLHDRLRAAAVVRSAADWTTDVLGSIVACHERAQLVKTD